MSVRHGFAEGVPAGPDEGIVRLLERDITPLERARISPPDDIGPEAISGMTGDAVTVSGGAWDEVSRFYSQSPQSRRSFWAAIERIRANRPGDIRSIKNRSSPYGGLQYVAVGGGRGWRLLFERQSGGGAEIRFLRLRKDVYRQD